MKQLCKNCMHWALCKVLFPTLTGDQTKCNWDSPRFRLKPRERWIAVIHCDKWQVEQLCDSYNEAAGYITAKKKDITHGSDTYGKLIHTEIIYMKEVL